ncbi:MAG: DUF192 domain-containing protein [Halobacteriovoraceae bacterium]|nr:DUF192 domain-containing protein [Halobacteriovoraceae bacterium]
MKCKNKNNIYNGEIYYANTFMTRLVGLMFKKKIEYGILLEPGNSIQTTFMSEPIDVIFLNSSNVVLKVYKNLAPWRFTRFVQGARKVLELPMGSLEHFPIIEGDQLEIDYV